MWNNWVNSGYTRMPAISFDEQNVNGQAHTGLHATGWFYTSYGSSTFWSGDDNQDGRQEEAKIRWEPFYNQGVNAVFEVEFWDANYNGVDTATKTQAKVNVSAYWVTNQGWIQDNRHLGAFCVNQYDGFWSC